MRLLIISPKLAPEIALMVLLGQWAVGLLGGAGRHAEARFRQAVALDAKLGCAWYRPSFNFFGWTFSFWVASQGALIIYVLIIGF